MKATHLYQEQKPMRQELKGRILTVIALLLLAFAVQFSLVGIDSWFIVGLNMIELTSPDFVPMTPDMPVVDVTSSFDALWSLPKLIELIVEIIKELLSLFL